MINSGNIKKVIAGGLCMSAAILIAARFDAFAGHFPQTGPLTSASKIFTFIGDGKFLMSVSAIVYIIGAFLKNEKAKSAGKTLFITILAANITVYIFKIAFERPMPLFEADAVLKLLEARSLLDFSGKYNSFPSGHTTASFAFAVALGTIFPRLRILFFSIAALVGFSRFYLGYHFPSDIISGAITGLSVGYVTTATDKDARLRWIYAGFAVLIIFMSFFKSGGYFVFDTDEAAYSESAREMAETGDMLTPTLNYEPRLDKPVLYYWLTASTYRLFGVNEFASRFVSGVFGMLLVMMTFVFINRIKGALPAFFVSLALLLNIEYFVYSHTGVTDMTFAFFIAAAIYSFYLGIHKEKPHWHLGFWIAAALAVLTKGAPGIFLPLAIVIIYLLVTRESARFKAFFKPLYVIIFFAICAPWFIVQSVLHGQAFYKVFVVSHIFERLAGANEAASQPFYFYLVLLLLGFFPWVAFLPAAIWTSIKERASKDARPYLLATIWFLLIFVFFTFASAKRANYVFPLFPAAAMLAGLRIADIIEGRPPFRRVGLYFLPILSIVLGMALFVMPFLEIKVALPLPFFVPDVVGWILIIISVLSVAAFYGPRDAFIGISAASVIMIILLRIYALAPVNASMQKDLYLLSEYAAACDKDVSLMAYELNKPSISFYTARKVVRIDAKNRATLPEILKRAKALIFIETRRLGELTNVDGVKIVTQKYKYSIVGNAECPYQTP